MSETDVITQRLQAIASDEGTARIPRMMAEAVRPIAADLLALGDEALALQLNASHLAVPGATEALIAAAAEQDLARIARALVVRSTFWAKKQGAAGTIDDVLRRAYPDLPPFLKEWAAERPGVHGPLGLEPGVDFQPADLVPWPSDRPLPAVDTPLGVQARLSREGHACGPHTGEWNEPTKRALKRLQLDNGLEPTGELDADTIEVLSDV